ncbi:MAG: Rieske 2Fe-2S domain-containing protein [Kiloniellaceae bacterium]
MTFIRNAWYVAGWSQNFGRDLTPLTVMNEDIVIYRTEAGEAVALTDECPHKRLPLSMGKLKGDAVECGYHGLTFGCDGKCIRVPGQSNLPASAWVRSYPIHEARGIVWIWMGEAEKADPALAFDMAEFDDPRWAPHYGDALRLECHYLPVADNLCDPAHVSFVHPTTLGSAASEDVPIDCERQGRTVVTSRWIRDAAPVGFFKAFGNFAGNVDRWHYYYLHAPNVAVIDFGSAAVEDAIGADERDKGVRLFALHFLTPVSETQTIDHWMHLRNIGLDDEEMGTRMNEQFRIAFAEDKAIMEAIQQREAKAPARKPLRIAIDRGPNFLRRIIAEMAAEEAPEGTAAAPMQAVS